MHRVALDNLKLYNCLLITNQLEDSNEKMIRLVLLSIFVQYYSYVSSSETIIGRDQLLATIPSWGPEFTLSLELFINSFPDAATNYAEVLRFTNSAVDCCAYGTRIPVIFLKVGDILEVSPPGGVPGQINVNRNTWYKINFTQYFHSNKECIDYLFHSLPLLSCIIFSITLRSR